MLDLLLIHPPATKASEPPLGAAVLLGHLRSEGLRADVLDANLGTYLHLLEPDRLAAAAGPQPATDLRRAVRHAAGALAALRSPVAAGSFPRYATAVGHLNRALGVWGGEKGGERLTLGDYRHPELSEFAPPDLERLSAGRASTLFFPYFHDVLLPQVEARQPRLIGISVNYRHQVLPAFELAGLLRRRFPEVPVIGGGGVFTAWRAALISRALRFSAFDHLVLGPGEGSLAALAKGEAPSGYLLEDAGTVGFRPDFAFADRGEYLSPVPMLPVSATRGCYWGNCSFCPEAATPVHPYAALETAEFPRLLRELADRYRRRHFHLTDNAIPPVLLRELAAGREEMAELTWHGFVRFERPLLDPALAAGLAAGGCRMLQLGLESGSQAVLDRLGKGIRLAEASAILRNLRQAGIAAYVYILLGTPAETRADAEATIDFLERHADEIGFLNVAIMNQPRQGGEGELPEEEELGFYRDFVPSPGWDRREVRRFLKERLLASPAVRAAVNRVPPAFTSNHAFLFR